MTSLKTIDFPSDITQRFIDIMLNDIPADKEEIEKSASELFTGLFDAVEKNDLTSNITNAQWHAFVLQANGSSLVLIIKKKNSQDSRDYILDNCGSIAAEDAIGEFRRFTDASGQFHFFAKEVSTMGGNTCYWAG